jgi:hypothetical protein
MRLQSHAMESPNMGILGVGGSHLSYMPVRALWINFGIVLIPAQTYFPGPCLRNRLSLLSAPHECLHVNMLSTCHQYVAQAICDPILRHVALAGLWLSSCTISRDRPPRTAYRVSLHLARLPKLARRTVYIVNVSGKYLNVYHDHNTCFTRASATTVCISGSLSSSFATTSSPTFQFPKTASSVKGIVKAHSAKPKIIWF